MAKEPPETEEQRAKKKEKKASDDRIKKKDKKEKKERKLIAELDIRLKADPPNKPPKAAVENGGSLPAPMPLSELVDEAMEVDLDEERLKKEERKQKKKLKKLEEEAIKRIMRQEIGPSPTASGRHIIAAKERRAQKRAEKRTEKLKPKAGTEAKAQAKAAAAALATATASDGDPAPFVLDTKSTPVSWEAVPAPSTAKGEEDPTAAAGEPAEGLNRVARRRLKLIARQREIIQKRLGVPVGSTEPNLIVDLALAEWTTITDERTAERLAKKKARKAKAAQRLRNKRSKLLKGRVMKEREKQLRKAERRAKWQDKTALKED